MLFKTSVVILLHLKAVCWKPPEHLRVNWVFFKLMACIRLCYVSVLLLCC